MASIRKVGDNTYSITIYLYTDENGKRVNHYDRFYGTKRKAEAHARILEAQLKRNPEGPRKAAMTLGEYLQKWIVEYKDDVTTRTWETAEWHVKRLIPVVGSLPLYNLTPPELRSALKDGFPNLAPSSVKNIYGTLRTALRRAVGDGILMTDPCQGIRTPKVPRIKREVLGLSQLPALLEKANEHKHHLVVRVLVLTGMRLGEALGLKWEDINLKRGTATIVRSIDTRKRKPKDEGDETKTENSRRTIKLDPETMQLLVQAIQQRQAEYRGSLPLEKQYVFGTGDRPLGDYSVRRTLNAALKKAKFDHIRIHDLRHGVGSILVDGGEELARAAALLGHTPETLLRTYTHALRHGEGLAGMLLKDESAEKSAEQADK